MPARFFALQAVALVVVISCLVLLRDTRGEEPDSSSGLQFPAFAMAFEVRTQQTVGNGELRYMGPRRWHRVTAAGEEEVRGRHRIQRVRGTEQEFRVEGDAIHVPWRWFGTLDVVVGLNRVRPGVSYTVTEAGAETLLELRYGDTVERHVFHSKTGIPLDYLEIVGGALVQEQKTSSLVLLETGEVIR